MTRVIDLLARPALDGAEVVGGPARSDAEVSEVRLIEMGGVLDTELKAHDLVQLASFGTGEHGSWHHIDLLLRRAQMAGCAAVVTVLDSSRLALASCRLADRLGIPLILVPPPKSDLTLAVELHRLVHDAQGERGRIAIKLVGDDAGFGDPDKVLERLESAISGSAGFVGLGSEIAGAVPLGVLTWVRLQQSPATTEIEGDTVVTLPLVERGATHPRGWLVVWRSDSSPEWVVDAQMAMRVLRGELLLWLQEARHLAERSARVHASLLAEILEHGDALPQDVRQRALDVGWGLGRWHTGIHLRVASGELAEGALMTALDQETLTRGRLTGGGVVERTDGWAAWVASDEPPSPDDLRRFAQGARTIAKRAIGASESARIGVGVGSPGRDIDGLRQTLAEARQAALVASVTAVEERVSVRAVQDLGASRLLLGWYGSPAFRDVADQILGPLLELNDPDTLTTLQAWLDRACSTAQTARVLGLHRNTVAQRIARAERQLGVSLSNPETRLALQLALRARQPA